MAKFNLAAAIAEAESGNVVQWEAIARHLIAANKPKAKRASKKAKGPQTWATVRLKDGRCFLTSAYARATEALTIAAHSETAQFRARMEDSGDRSDAGAFNRVFLNPAIKAVPVHHVVLIEDPAMIENARDYCYAQRAQRQGWNIPTIHAIAA